MQLLNNISDHQNKAFGDAENGCFWCFQNTDNQYRYSRKITPNSTGKELDAETGFSYFGARYIDHTLTTAWLSVDPMADKYPSISPYAYCAWNPMKLVDPDGEKPRLLFHGNASRKTFEKIVNEGLGGQFEAKLTKNSNGSYTFDIVATKGGGDVKKLTERQRSFYNSLKDCIDAKTKDGKELNYDIDVYYGSADVNIGNYKNNAIDVADMDQFNDLQKGGATKQGKLIHEFVEQWKKAYYGNKKGDEMGYRHCHSSTVLAEGNVNGNKRDINGDKTIARGVTQETFIENGRKHYVKIKNNPIVIVTQ